MKPMDAIFLAALLFCVWLVTITIVSKMERLEKRIEQLEAAPENQHPLPK